MARNFIGLIVGVAVGFVLVALLEAGGHWLAPPPADLNLNDAKAMKKYVKTAPEGVMLLLLGAWFIGVLGAVASAAMIARAKVICGLAIGGIFLAFAILNLVMIPHPTWVMFATPFVYAVGVSLGIAAALAVAGSRPTNRGASEDQRNQPSKPAAPLGTATDE